MRTRKLWKFPWFPHIPDVVTWNVFNCYNHVVAHREFGTNHLQSIQTPNSPISSPEFPRVFQPLNDNSIILIQYDAKSPQWKARSSASKFYRLKYTWHWTHYISIKDYEHGWRRAASISLHSNYCRKSATVKISTRPFLILQSPLISRLSLAWTAVLFRSLMRDLTVGVEAVTGGSAGGGVTACMSHVSQVSWISPDHDFYVFTSLLSISFTLLVLVWALNFGRRPGSLVSLSSFWSW